MMQWFSKHPKIHSIVKWGIYAIIMAVLAAFGAADFAHLFLPEAWMAHKTLVLGAAQFVAYLAGVGVVLWKWRSIKAWCGKIFARINSEEGWSASDIIWAGLAVMGVIGFAPLFLPEWARSDSSILERLQFAAYLVGGGFLIWQLRISNRRASAAEKNAALVEKGNITERFKNAIEFLASDVDSVQIGGIYTLYHVAKEAKEYKEAVLKILIAHLRKITEAEPTSRVAIAILDALFARKGEKPLFEAVDLSYMNLKGIGRGEFNAFSYNLNTICGSSSDLTGAYLAGAQLSGANLGFAICENTHFSRAVCVGTSFYSVKNFNGAKFDDADLTGANFMESSITAQQLLQAKTLYQAALPPDVYKEIRQERPRLLDPPAPESEKGG